ncbi:MAG: histidine phosphatase family protein [Myxococcota bacterium]
MEHASLTPSPHILHVIRHAPLEQPGRCYGQLDLSPPMPLAEVVQAMRIQLDAPPQQILSSPLQRCHLPAQQLAKHYNIPLSVDTRLMEVSYGRWEGLLWSEIEQQEPDALQAWMSNWQQEAPPEGESLLHFFQRVEQWWKEWQTQAPQNSLLVAHAGVIRALYVLRGESWQEAMSRKVEYLRCLTFTHEPA